MTGKAQLAAATWAILATQAAAAAEEPSPIAFVGRFVAIEKLECESTEEVDEKAGEIIVGQCMDELFRVTYEVEKVLEGNFMVGEHVVFGAADHYGSPPFADYLRALLYLGRFDDGLWHIKRQWDLVYRTVDGDFATCGCDINVSSDTTGRKIDPPANCLSVNFSPPVTIDMTHVSSHYADEIRSSLDYRVQGNVATCIRGIGVEDVYRRDRGRLVKLIKD